MIYFPIFPASPPFERYHRIFERCVLPLPGADSLIFWRDNSIYSLTHSIKQQGTSLGVIFPTLLSFFFIRSCNVYFVQANLKRKIIMKRLNQTAFLTAFLVLCSAFQLSAQRQVRITADGITNGGTESANSSELEFKEGSFSAEIDLVSDGSLRLGVGSVPTDLIIAENGRIGINTSSPSDQLDVNGDISLSGSNRTINLMGNSGELNFMNGSTREVYLDYNGTDFFIDNNRLGGDVELDANTLIRFQTDNIERMVIDETGRVGIGITSAGIPTGYLLAVDGNVISERVRVRLSGDWPDYVFAENYPLLPLNDLKETIKEEGHLPNMPDAATVQEEGQDLGDMQVLMMEKIEELTLYIIELHERVAFLEKENEVLKSEKK